jgi:diadenosine tetraphosphate (Ap4A) HIT family hydrolase
MYAVNGCVFCAVSPQIIIKSTPFFHVVADPYPITRGHMMIISRQHYGCCGELDTHAFIALNHLRENVEKIYKARYGRFVCYEHGRAGSCTNVSGTSECHHMHLHFLPILVDLHRLIDASITRYRIAFLDLADFYNTYGSYLLTGNSTAGYHFYNLSSIDTTGLPPHYIRSKIASAIGCPQRANWETMPVGESTYLDIKSIKDDLSRPC